MQERIGCKKLNIDGFTISYYGQLPEKGIFVSFSSKSSSYGNRCLYSTALEIAFNGYDGVYIPGSSSASIFEKGILDAGGKLFPVLPYSLESASRGILSKAMVSNGGVFSPFADSFSIDKIDKAKTIASIISNVSIVAEENIRYRKTFNYIDTALSYGKDVAILKSSLLSPFARTLAREGAPVIDSFSSFLQFPKYIVFYQEHGMYGIDDGSFDIMYIDE